ncbi:unnamed protein product [Camellia sinensis]
MSLLLITSAMGTPYVFLHEISDCTIKWTIKVGIVSRCDPILNDILTKPRALPRMELSTIEEINETSYMVQCYLGMKQKKFLGDARELMNFTIECWI